MASPNQIARLAKVIAGDIASAVEWLDEPEVDIDAVKTALARASHNAEVVERSVDELSSDVLASCDRMTLLLRS